MHPRQRLILNFHGLGSPPAHVNEDEAPFWLPLDFFAQVLDRIKGKPDVHITFDDGNASDFESALPELVRRGQTAEFFLVASKIDEPGYLTRPQIKAMVTAGMTVGTHGMVHRPWPGCDDRTLSSEINDARTRIEEVIARPVTSASCPFGSYDRRTLKALRTAGFDRVYTSDRGVARSDDWLQCRNTLRIGDTLADVERLLHWKPRFLSAKADRLRVWFKSRR
jgi:peptidoglycan/xylan/chitin deacetylase (PgdA/CDA1 family)